MKYDNIVYIILKMCHIFTHNTDTFSFKNVGVIKNLINLLKYCVI